MEDENKVQWSSGLDLGSAAKSTEITLSNVNERPTFIFKVPTLSFENLNVGTASTLGKFAMYVFRLLIL